MDNDKFSLLISVLDKLEEGCVGHSGLEDAIIKIINYFGYSLTKKQKKELSKALYYIATNMLIMFDRDDKVIESMLKEIDYAGLEQTEIEDINKHLNKYRIT